MMLNHFILIFFLFKSTDAHDVIRDALNSIDQFSDPCDNFYAHVCTYTEPGFLTNAMYAPIFEKLIAQQRDSSWENLESMVCSSKCETQDLDLHNFLLKVEQIMYRTLSPKCHFTDCMTLLESDNNCTRASETLQSRLQPYHGNVVADMKMLNDEMNKVLENIRVVSMIIDGDYREGIEFVNENVKNMISIVTKMIEKTSWAQNQGVTKTIKQLVEEIVVDDNYAVQLRSNIDVLMDFEQKYLKCTGSFKGDFNLLCLQLTWEVMKTTGEPAFFKWLNAGNFHPTTIFGLPIYAIAKDAKETAGKLGSAIAVAGHELSHSIIESPYFRQLLPFSSEEAIQCVQSQFNNTCNEFGEVSKKKHKSFKLIRFQGMCGVSDVPGEIDENGSDLLGLQLAYELFLNEYQGREEDIYLQLNHRNITYQQLFFYAFPILHCRNVPRAVGDPHSTAIVRANILVQIPAFQDAFQCSDDSRMMKTMQKQCNIYGENAPQQKK
ncbi:hypothetical protein CRE_00122 [Caenorhabditis remanei]|uniref:Peptidase M13 C-terminal domain-containing protein n=1 Tax=Caenorhabditis remanei TaxID=31234 RepID=E3LD94_CAERE|nr:hypothetical protein CRE_00122 [Caenorhabditis remanei]